MKRCSALLEARLRLALGAERWSVASVSDSIEGLLGFSPQQLLGGAILLEKLIHPGDRDISDELFSTASPAKSGTFNLRLRHKDGRIRCVRGQYEKHPDEAGNTAVLELLLQDAKSLRQRFDALPMADYLQALLENTDDYIYFKDRNHVFTGASQTLVTLTKPAEHWTDLLGQTDYDVFPEKYADIYYELEKQVFAGVPVAHEVQEILIKGERKGWVDNRKYPIRDASGEIIGLFGIARDITEQKTMEDALSESEKRFRSIFEQVPSISVQGYDEERKVIFWNEASEHLYGFRREQALGQRLEDLIIPEPMREAVVHLVSEWVAGGEPIPAAELTLKNADGGPVEVFSSHVMLRDKHGEPEMYCIDVDISERKRMEDQVRQLAFHDPLTGLPNRRLLSDRLSQAMAASKRSGFYGALMFLDLDHFKTLNDMHGHEVGDLLLIEAAVRLNRCVRETDTVARFGGDEFVVMLNELNKSRADSLEKARQVATKIRIALSEPYELTLHQKGQADIQFEHRCTVSIGLTLFLGNDASQDELLKWADAAMYKAKDAGRNMIYVHEAPA